MPELPQVAHPKSEARHVAIAIAAALAVTYLAWSHLDQTASRVVLPATGLSIALAWYSILSLRERRGENFWQTIDRLLRAAFVAVTLVFVVEIAFTPATQPVHGNTETIYVQSPPSSLADELNALEATWTPGSVTPVIEKHFAKLNRGEPVMLRVANSKHFVTFQPTSGGVKIIEVR